MALPYIRHKNLTASALIDNAPAPANLFGWMVNSHTGGTLKIWDSLTASGDVVFNTITFPAGSGLIYYFPDGLNFSVGIFATIGGTADITFFVGGIDR